MTTTLSGAEHAMSTATSSRPALPPVLPLGPPEADDAVLRAFAAFLSASVMAVYALRFSSSCHASSELVLPTHA